ncbi:hypothetical protein BDN72DRAFT_913976 [Pluteus cervinus]|uniref:Uncharacterized protein n=1 Tax=Pluteus cervinus TaxID=181527 RepID=A0ACD3ANH0_9AGAR|nr:hypothetical protein BDN72DRAFT_913976 [Pluteus cervinus]
MIPGLDSDIKRSSSESPFPVFIYQLPPLPRIAGNRDILLDVHTHSSLRNTGLQNVDYGDGERLRILGEQIFSSVVTMHYFSQKPLLSHSEIVLKLRDAFCDQKVLEMSDSYDIARLLMVPAGSRPVGGDIEELRYYWYRFIGALYIRNGLDAVQSWVSKVIDPPFTRSGPSSPSPSGPDFMDESDDEYAGQYAGPPPPQTLLGPPPRQYDPRRPFFTPAPDPNNSGNVLLYRASQTQPVPSFNLVALLNERAQKAYGYLPDYLADHEGSAHAGQWTVRCLLGGFERGRGIGLNQKLAKNNAARQALINLGWGN